jgi:hypothetical protein
MNSTQRDSWKTATACFLIEGVVIFLMASNFTLSGFRSREDSGREPKRFRLPQTND